MLLMKPAMVVVLALSILVSGCTSTQNGDKTLDNGKMMEESTVEKPGGMMEKNATTIEKNNTMVGNEGAMMEKYQGKMLAGKTSPLLDFVKADYDAAIKTDKLIVLYFYADWCPVCRAEVPKLYEAFNELQTDKLIGFRVNFNDGSTDADEKALAEQFAVAYQHTKVFLKNNQRVLKSPESWNQERYLAEIGKFS